MNGDDQRPAEPTEEAANPIEDWQAKASEYKDKWLRTAADFDNYIKRQQRDRQKQDIELRIRIIRKILPLLDDLERALKFAPKELADDDWMKGVTLIMRKFKSVLDEFDVKEIESVGKPFDPAYHEAVMTEPSDLPEGTVIEELAKGYTLEDQLVRAAAVKTSSGPEKNDQVS